MQDDPVEAEVEVFLSQALSTSLHLLQYPLRPAHLPLEPTCVQNVRMRSEFNEMEIRLRMSANGENYSHSKGEGYAQDSATTGSSHGYQSGVMDSYTLMSCPQPPLSQRYVAGVLRNGELHLSPLHGIIQLKPSLVHLDTVARKQGSVSTEAGTDGDTTESEGEDAKPVTVKIARRDAGSRSKRISWSELSSRRQSQEEWLELDFHPLTSQEACDDRKLLFASEEMPIYSRSLCSEDYLNKLCPQQDKMLEESISSNPPSGLSLSKLKSLPVSNQVHDLLVSSGVVTLDRLHSLLQFSRSQLPVYIEALQEHGVLVQGCWVVASHILYPTDMTLSNGRDYLLYCFTQTRCLAKKDLVKVPHQAVKQVLTSLATPPGQEFKLPTDSDFINKYPHIVSEQDERWKKRLEELKSALNLSKEQYKSPSSNSDIKKQSSKKQRLST